MQSNWSVCKKTARTVKAEGGRHYRRLLAFTVPIVLALCVGTYIAVVSVLNDFQDIRAHLESAKSSASEAASLIKAGENAQGKERLLFSERELSSAQRRLQSGSPLFIAFIPFLGNNVRALEGMTIVGRRSVVAGSTLADLWGDLGRAKKSWVGTGTLDLSVMKSALRSLEHAQTEIQMARAEDGEIPDTFLFPAVAKARSDLSVELAKLNVTVEKSHRLASMLPAILGEKGKRKYFLAVQNNAELRATGGLIGNYGIISADRGRLVLESFDEIHALQKDGMKPVDAPREFVENHSTLRSTSLWLNANMSPDFPTSARIITALYKESTGKEIDGVIAVDPVGLSYLLKATGPVKLTDLGVTVGHDNAVKWTLSDAYADFDKRSERKDSLRLLATAVWRKIVGGEVKDSSDLVKALGRSLDERHLMIYLNDPAEERRITELGYAGEVKKYLGDYLLVNVENYGMNKVDYYLEESIFHNVDLKRDGSARMVTSVQLYNGAPSSGLSDYAAGRASPDAPPASNQAYVSVFVPKGSRLRRATVDGSPSIVDVETELGRMVYGVLAKVRPGSRSLLQFEYDVSNVVNSGQGLAEYSLLVQKQALVNDAIYNISLSSTEHVPVYGDFKALGKSVKAEGRLATDVTLKETFRLK